MILCDTDIIIDVVRRHPAAVTWADSVRAEELIVPGYVAMELVQGCTSSTAVEALDVVMRPFRIAWLDARGCAGALQTLKTVHLSHGVGLVDALIAHTAIALGAPLHTFNIRHFAAVPYLRTIQPYAR